jgi:hypothetical protein
MNGTKPYFVIKLVVVTLAGKEAVVVLSYNIGLL